MKHKSKRPAASGRCIGVRQLKVCGRPLHEKGPQYDGTVSSEPLGCRTLMSSVLNRWEEHCAPLRCCCGLRPRNRLHIVCRCRFNVAYDGETAFHLTASGPVGMVACKTEKPVQALQKLTAAALDDGVRILGGVLHASWCVCVRARAHVYWYWYWYWHWLVCV